MQVKHIRTLAPAQNGFAKVQSICWSPNNRRLAVADCGRFINLYDEAGERREKFSTRPADGKGGKSFVIRAMCFSPDSSKIAVAQSDYIIFVYRLGLEWGEKKSICNKFPQNSSVTCMTWPSVVGGASDRICFGSEEGKVKVAIPSSNKSQILFNHDHMCVSICAAPDGNSIITGHADFSIYRFVFEGEDGSIPVGSSRIAMHTCIPTSMSWGEHIAVSGSDCVVTFYDRTGHTMQTFDYDAKDDREHTVVAVNPSGQTVAVAARDKIRILNFSLRSRKWEDGITMNLPNSYSFSNMVWKADGSRLVTGNLTGAVDLFDACLKRYRLRGAFEFTYVSHNQVIVKHLSTGTRIVLRSHFGYEILKVHVHKDRYLVANTATTILIGDLVTCSLSEVPWQLTGREKFVFDNPQVCMVLAAGELCLIEYGKNEVLGTCRTDETNMHRMSVRIHEPVGGSSNAVTRKFIAYLVDRQTIQVDDLVTGIAAAHISHPHKIDWLELNHRATKLLFRDKQRQLYLYDLVRQQKSTLLNYCAYVQWVPDSDVVVAQNRVELCVWYSIDNPDRVAIVPIKGEVEGIERAPGKTEVIVDEGVNTVAYGLNESLIEFGTAMEDEDYDRACDLLDQIALTPETEAMWQSLSAVAIQDMKLYIAERCFAALGDVAKAHALSNINRLAAEAAKESNGATDGYDHYTVRAELFILNREFRRAEQVYLDNGQVDKAIAMWEEMQRFNEAIQIAEARNHPDAANKRAQFYTWLRETGQHEKAGELREREGKYAEAIELYLRGGTPARAANVISAHDVKPEPQVLEAIASALFKAKIYEKAGGLFEKLKMDERAIDAYKRGNVFSRAVDLAKRVFPNYVVGLEEAWGEYLVSQRQVDQAINHFMEAQKLSKAVNAAITSRQWNKAVQILETQGLGDSNDETVKTYYKQIAHHYEEIHQMGDAEKFYIKGGAINDAVEMYSRAGMSDHMYRVAQRHLKKEQLTPLFVAQGAQLESKGDYAGAERIYIKINEPDKAIVMYKKARDFNSMIRLVTAYRPDYIDRTHLSLAAMFEKEGNLKLAENHYVLGKDWGKAVNLYRDRDLWDDAVRVAKVHGGANASKQVVLSRALAVDAEEGVRMLIKFSLVDSGIDAALEGFKFDVALQWAQLALPGKLPYVYLKTAMNHEDQGEFRQAEENFIKAQKPREAIDMYTHQHEFESAMRVAEAHDVAAIPIICTAHARVCFQQNRFADAEELLIRARQPDLLIKFYLEASMFNEAQRIAREYAPEKVSEIARRQAETLGSNDPIQAGQLLEESGDFLGAIDKYLHASKEHYSDAERLVTIWAKAVKIASNHARHVLRDTIKTATGKMIDLGRPVEAAKCYEDTEDYRGAINCYIQGAKFDLAEQLAQRIKSTELSEHVKEARVKYTLKDSSPEGRAALESMDSDAALKAHVSNNDWDKALKLARQRGAEEAKTYGAMYCQYLLRNDDAPKAIEVINRDGMEVSDFRFFSTWAELGHGILKHLPNAAIDLSTLHEGLNGVVATMEKTGQDEIAVAHTKAVRDVVHIYHASAKMKDAGFDDFALKLMLGLPRYVREISPDKAYFDAGMAAKQAGDDATAFLFLNRFLDIVEKIEDKEDDSSNLDNSDFKCTDFPSKFKLPRTPAIDADSYEEANKWVLAMSVENIAHPELPTIATSLTDGGEPMYIGCLHAPDGKTFEPCAITGFPVMGAESRCKGCHRPANQEEWNKYVMVAKACPWCGAPSNPDFSM